MGFNQVQDCFWNDQYVESLNQSECMVYNFLLTSPDMNTIGLYSVTERNIGYYCRIDVATVHSIMEKFISDDKIAYDGQVVWLKNRHKYSNWQNNSNHVKFAINTLKSPLIANSKVSKEFSEFFADVLKCNPKAKRKQSDNSLDSTEIPSECHPDTIQMQFENHQDSIEIPSGSLTDNRLTDNNIKIPVVKNSKQDINSLVVKNNCADSQKCEPQNSEKVFQQTDFCKSSQDSEQNVPKSVLDKPKTQNEKKQRLTPDDHDFWKFAKENAELAETFYKATGISPVKSQFGRWVNDCRDLSEAEINVDRLQKTIAYMQSENIPLSAPGSCLKTAQWLKSRCGVPVKSRNKQNEQKSFREIAEEIIGGNAENDMSYVDSFFARCSLPISTQSSEVIDV